MANSEDYIDGAIARAQQTSIQRFCIQINQFDVNIAVKVQRVTMFRTKFKIELMELNCFEVIIF